MTPSSGPAAPVLDPVGDREHGASRVDPVVRGEARVKAQLDRLGEGWYVLRALTPARRHRAVHHVVIGPAGVFTLHATCRPRGRAVVSHRRLRINRRRTRHLRTAQFHSERAGRLLTDACGFPVGVRPVLVLVDLRKIRIKRQPKNGVHVIPRSRLVEWLQSLPEQWPPRLVDAMYATARQQATWSAPAPPPTESMN